MSARFNLPVDHLKHRPESVLRSGDVTIIDHRSSTPSTAAEVHIGVPMIMAALSGEAALAWGPHRVAAAAGEALFATPGAYRMSDETPHGRVLLMFIEPEFVAAFQERHSDTSGVRSSSMSCERAFRVSLTPYLIVGIESLRVFLETVPPPSQRLVEHKLDEIVLSLIEADPRVWPQLRSVARRERSLVRYVETQASLRQSVSSLARGAGHSLSTFKRRFRTATGASPATWLRRRRLDRARFLLETTDRSVTDIGFEMGFSSVSHFIQAFRRRHGMTPVGARRTHSDEAAWGALCRDGSRQ
jgi:AraC-like DNA-binding protein